MFDVGEGLTNVYLFVRDRIQQWFLSYYFSSDKWHSIGLLGEEQSLWISYKLIKRLYSVMWVALIVSLVTIGWCNSKVAYLPWIYVFLKYVVGLEDQICTSVWSLVFLYVTLIARDKEECEYRLWMFTNYMVSWLILLLSYYERMIPVWNNYIHKIVDVITPNLMNLYFGIIRDAIMSRANKQ